MLTEPHIGRDELTKMLKNEFNIVPTSIEFIPKGEDSWGYKIVANEKIYFLKIYAHTNPNEERFEILHKLYYQAGIKNIVHAYGNISNTYTSSIQNYSASLFDYIQGKDGYDVHLNNTHLEYIGQILGKIHEAYTTVGKYTEVETFNFEHNNKLLQILESADQNISNEPDERSEAKKIIEEHQLQIRAKLEEITELSKILIHKETEFVICHGDPHMWNILLDEHDQLYLIDWDGMIFAPKEKDLNYYDKNQAFFRGYKKVRGDISIDRECERYYQLFWILSEIVDWSSKILNTPYNQIEYNRALAGLKDTIRYL